VVERVFRIATGEHSRKSRRVRKYPYITGQARRAICPLWPRTAATPAGSGHRLSTVDVKKRSLVPL
jgi:hypothetical protein